MHYWGKSAYLGAAAYTLSLGLKTLFTGDSTSKYKTVEAAFALGGTAALVWIAKVSIDRKRPFEQYPDFISPFPEESGKSFPSGQTSLAFETATLVWLHSKDWRWGVPLFVWAGGVAYSRLHLAQHYPSDVLAGALLGAGSAWASQHLNKWLNRNKKSVRARR